MLTYFVNHQIYKTKYNKQTYFFQVKEVLKRFWKRKTNRGGERYEPSKFCHINYENIIRLFIINLITY